MTTALELIHGDPECQYKHFTAKVGEPINPDADVDIECFMSTDSVDSDDEVMLPNGIDLSRYAKNPVVMLCHAMGQPGCFYPLPVGKALWTKQARRGVLAGVRFARDTEMGRQVKSLFDEGMLRSFSVGFRPLEASGMTRKEAESRPDWQEAYERTKGQVRVHRKWSLIELSVAPIPSNPDALVTTYKAKGILVPSWLNLKSKANTMDDEPEVDDEDKAAEACECGKADCAKCSPEEPVETKAEEEIPAEVPPEAEEDEPEPEEIGPLKRYDHVNVKAPHYKGFGRIESIHTKGHVPHAEQDMMGSKEDPAACVKCYKAMGDGHMPTEHHVAAKVAHLSKMAIPMSPPTKKAVEATVETKTVRTEPVIEHIEIRVKSDQEVRAEMITKLNAMLSPEGLRKMVREEAERITGVV